MTQIKFKGYLVSEEQSSPATEAGTEATAEVVIEDNGVATEQEMSYANGKYTSVSDLEKGYAELQKSYSQKLGAFTGAPEAYELGEGVSVPEGVLEYAREQQFSNEALNGLVEAYSSEQNAAAESYIQEQREALGKDADTRINNVKDWARANLGEDSLEALNGMVTTAAGVEMFERIAKINQGTAPAQVAAPKQSVDKDTLKAMRFAKDEFGNRKMSSDPSYRAKVEGLEAELFTK